VAAGRSLVTAVAASALRVVRVLALSPLCMPSVDEHLDVWIGVKLLPQIVEETIMAPRHDEQPMRYVQASLGTADVVLEQPKGRNLTHCRRKVSRCQAWPGNGAWIAGAMVLLLLGCAGLTCRPASITVAKKEERARLEATPRGFTSETGRLEELRRPEIVREYWVLDAGGTWHRISLEQYRAAEVGQVLDLCQ
jgi:hypothetical protein